MADILLVTLLGLSIDPGLACFFLGQAGNAPAAGGKRELWGGAMSIYLPASFTNVRYG